MIPEWLSRKLNSKNIDISITQLNVGPWTRMLVELRDSADKKGGKSWAQTFDPEDPEMISGNDIQNDCLYLAVHGYEYTLRR